MVGKCLGKGNARLGTITWVKTAEGEGNSAGPRWQGRCAPVLGRRWGRERGAVEVVAEGSRCRRRRVGAAAGGGGPWNAPGEGRA